MTNSKVSQVPKLHILKLEECFWQAILQGKKKSEVRKDDQDFQTGDTIVFAINSPLNNAGPEPIMEYQFKITHVLRGGQYGIESGYVVLSIEPLTPKSND